MSGDIIKLIIAWLPLALFLIVLLVFVLMVRRQTKTYYAHVDEVNRVNRELVEVMKEQLTVSRESLVMLTSIKSVLETRKL